MTQSSVDFFGNKCQIMENINRRRKLVAIIFPTPLVGGGTIYSNGFFCSVNFGRSIYSS